MVEQVEKEEVRKILENERAELNHRLEQVHGWPTPSDDLDNPDNTVSAQDYDMQQRASALAEIFQLRLVEIDQALARLEEGSYGKCSRCGEEISAERLRVDPLAKFCTRCEEYPAGHEPPVHPLSG